MLQKKLLNNRQELIDAFKTGIFLNIHGFQVKKESEESEEESEGKKSEKIKHDFKKFIEYIVNESKDINYELFKDYFNYVKPSALTKKLLETKKEKKKNELVEKIKNRWSNLKDEIEKMSEDGKETEQPDKILKIVEEIVDFNRKKKPKTKGFGIKDTNTKPNA